MDYTVLRENDIRGEYPNQINESFSMIIGKAFGTYILNNQGTSCIVGHDNRISADALHQKLIEGIISTGVNVIDIGLCTTPMFNFSARYLNITYGIMITASHNPSHHNGFKIFGKNFSHLEQDELNIFYNLIKEGKFSRGLGAKTFKNLQKEYINMLISKANVNSNLNIVIDTGSGTPSIIIKDIFDRLFNNVIYLNSESDGTFPVHNPDPNDPENLKELISVVKEKNADLGLAFDGDGDRLGVVDNNGNIVPTDTLIGIYASSIIPKTKNKKVLIDVKCSSGLTKEINKIGGEAIMIKNGSAYIENEMINRDVLLGGEYSGHVFFRDDFDGYDDGIYASIRLLNILNEKNKKCSDLYEHFEKYYSTPEIKIITTEEDKWLIVDKVKEYALNKYSDVLTIDGVRVNYNDGFALIRGSNTSSYITLRFEAKNEEELNLRKREFINLVNFYIKN
ncbi:MAG: phosphomannomutase/phosphoglucomutase [Bacilli bacterium]|nr:phosphomannomutase/phosphoglucomutase [Bacilli bacterium]MDD4795882.1 phosphomannomutase/phosphoglucomutase [Bacilli bacterium]